MCKGCWPVGPEGLSSPLQETRRNPLAKENCNFASWMRNRTTQKHIGKRTFEILRLGCGTATAPRAGGRMPPTGCKASGEDSKKALEEIYFHPRLFSVFIAPVGADFRSSSFMQKQGRCGRGKPLPYGRIPVSCGNMFVTPDCVSHSGCRADRPAVGSKGPRRPLRVLLLTCGKQVCFPMYILEILHLSLQNVHTMVK